MLLADWDRHADQWRWGKKDSAGTTVFYPMAVDRDQVYFRNTGLLVKIMSISATPHMRGFSEDTDHLRELNYKAHTFDRFFLNMLDAAEWEQHIATFRKQLTDDVIRTAIQKLPPEIYNISGEKLIATLKKRREDLAGDGMRYYRFIATDPFLVLKDEPEIVELKDNGSTATLTIYNTGGKNIIYTRTLNPKETKKIHLFNVKGDDVLKINSSKIKVAQESLPAEKFL